MDCSPMLFYMNEGSSVKGFKVGDAVGVGCLVDSCLSCVQCLAGNEHKCTKGMTATYQGENKHGRAAVYPSNSVTAGNFIHKVPAAVLVIHQSMSVTSYDQVDTRPRWWSTTASPSSSHPPIPSRWLGPSCVPGSLCTLL